MFYDKEEFNEEGQDLYFVGQHRNTFEIANRVFYATVDKFTKQLYPDTKRRSAPYSFRECWHLHSIYSKSQQTLLGIYPVKPSVLLSGDDTLFTHEFSPCLPDDEEDWNVGDYANLTIDGLAVGAEEDAYRHEPFNTTRLFRVASHQDLYEPEDDLQHTSSSDNSVDSISICSQHSYNSSISSIGSIGSISSSSSSSSSRDNQHHHPHHHPHHHHPFLPTASEQPLAQIEPLSEILPRSSSLISSNTFVSAKSNFSYQSLSDILQENHSGTTRLTSHSVPNYGATLNHPVRQSNNQPPDDDNNTTGSTILSRFLTFVLYFWSLFLSVFKERRCTPLLP